MLSKTNITQPDPYGWQVRVVRRGTEYSRYFSHNLWGGKNRALKAANSWRDQIKIIKKASTRRFAKASSNNKSTGVLGVCKTHSIDNRKNIKYLVYGVSWIDHNGKKKCKSFRVCNVEAYDATRDKLAFQQAQKFRKEWEHHADNDTLHLFDASIYMNWRKEKIK